MRTIAELAVGALLALSLAPLASGQTVLGARLDLKERPGFPETRKLVFKAKEAASPDPIAGDAAANGATVQVIVNGATSTSQTISLPPGERWRRSPSDPAQPLQGWRYKERLSLGIATPVDRLDLVKTSSRAFKVLARLTGRYQPLDIAVPDPGTYAGLVVTIGGGGSTTCTNFGGAAGGSFARNDAVVFRVVKPAAEGTCPSGTPVCGDGVIQGPFETCDAGNDAACPGLCGANGLPCLCPLCGDGVIDPGEVCDRPNPGPCTDGCSFQCTCASCGNGIVETPIESCESDLDCGGDPCAPPGAPNQCRCPACGDDIVNQAYEQCDGTDDAACPGLCIPYVCACPVCGNDQVEPGEQCDGTDDGACPGACRADCTCP